MSKIKNYMMELENREEKFNIMGYFNNIDSLFNRDELESKIITVGELNNILGNNIALLKIIDVVTSYNYPLDVLKDEIKSIKDMDRLQLEANTDIYIKVLTTKETYFLKVREELDYYNPAPVTLELLEKLISRDKQKGFKHKIISPGNVGYSYFYYGVKDGTHYNRFEELVNIEFLVTGLGIELDPRANLLDNLIILDGVPSDYRKTDLE